MATPVRPVPTGLGIAPDTAPATAPGASQGDDTRTIPVLRGLATGGPEHEAPQAEIRRRAAEAFPAMARSPALDAVFENAMIDRRTFSRPLDWYEEPRSFAEKNAAYVEVALDLSERLARDALADAGVAAADVDAVVFVSSTGVSTPSLDAYLAQRLGIDPNAVRLPLWGLGCAGGAAGLARAGDLVRAGYRNVLLVAVELCSLTFVRDDLTARNLVGIALFGDGGAAAVLGAEGDGDGPSLVRLLRSHSALLPESAELTGWDVVEQGFRLRLSKKIPGLVAQAIRPAVDDALAAGGWTLDDVDTVVVHPGGAKVITGYEVALGLDEHALDATRTVLREHGNMSSPTVLFVLAEALRAGPSGRGLISASGPGFTFEHLLVDFG